MEIMVYCLLWVVQDLYHQPYEAQYQFGASRDELNSTCSPSGSGGRAEESGGIWRWINSKPVRVHNLGFRG